MKLLASVFEENGGNISLMCKRLFEIDEWDESVDGKRFYFKLDSNPRDLIWVSDAEAKIWLENVWSGVHFFRSIISPVAEHEFTWDQWERMAEVSSHIDYGCEFNKDGCRKQKRPACCCSSCVPNHGYLRRIPTEAVEQVMSLWSRETGFWRSGQGCTLPRKWRSGTCLGYFCWDDSTHGLRNRIPLTTIRRVFNHGRDCRGPRTCGIPPIFSAAIRTLKHTGAWK